MRFGKYSGRRLGIAPLMAAMHCGPVLAGRPAAGRCCRPQPAAECMPDYSCRLGPAARLGAVRRRGESGVGVGNECRGAAGSNQVLRRRF